jgi:aminocarboxymuconate-semialdehyde decarboxylase
MTAPGIDIHAHCYPRRYLELIAEEGAPFGARCALCAPDGPVVKVGKLFAGPLGGKFIDLDARISAMDEQGVALPYLIGRLHHGWNVRPELKHRERGPRDYLARFYYDTISHDPKALAFLIDAVGADRVLMGSDYCFDMGYERPVEVVTTHPGLSEDDRAAILDGNARRVLGL